jgi:hypothetical protein
MEMCSSLPIVNFMEGCSSVNSSRVCSMFVLGLGRIDWPMEEVYYCTNLQHENEADCNNYRGILVLWTSYKMLSNILLSRLSPCVDEIIDDHQCGFWRNWTTTEKMFSFIRLCRKKWEYNETVHQLFIHRLQEDLWFSKEGGIVQYSHRVWDTH